MAKTTTVTLKKGCIIDGKAQKSGAKVTLPAADAKYLVGCGTATEKAPAKEEKAPAK